MNHDEIKNARVSRRKERRKKTLGVILLLLGFFVAFFLFVTSYSKVMKLDFEDGFRSTFAVGSYPVELNETISQVQLNDRSICLLSLNQLNVVSGTGARILHTTHAMSNAQMASNAKRIVVYSISGKSYQVYNRSALIGQFSTENEIIDACVSNSGKYALLTKGSEYTSELIVFNKNTQKRFSWFGSDGFPLACFQSATADEACVISVKSDNGRLYSVATVINLDSQEELYSVTEEGLFVKGCLDNDGLSLVMDSKCVRFSKDGTRTAEYPYSGQQILDISFSRNSSICLAFGDNRRSETNSFVVLSKKLEPLCTVDYKQTINDTWLENDRIFILNRGLIFEYNLTGQLLQQYYCPSSSESLVYLGGPIVVSIDTIEKVTEVVVNNDANTKPAQSTESSGAAA